MTTCFPSLGLSDAALNAVISVPQPNQTFLNRRATDGGYRSYYDGQDGINIGDANFEDSMTLDRGYAPFGVLFDALASTPTPRVKDGLTYTWKLFDTDGTTVLRESTGWYCGYIYETAGTYTAELTITDGGNTSVTTKTVSVWSRDGNTYYVDSALGDDRYNGLAETPNLALDPDVEPVGTIAGPFKTATRAFMGMRPRTLNNDYVGAEYSGLTYCTNVQNIQYRFYSDNNRNYKKRGGVALNTTNARTLPNGDVGPAYSTTVGVASSHTGTGYRKGDSILFKRGQIFKMDLTVPLLVGGEEEVVGGDLLLLNHWDLCKGVMFGAYGSGNKPILKNHSTTNGTCFHNPTLGMFHLSFVDLVFDLESMRPFPGRERRWQGGPKAVLWFQLGNPINIVMKRVDYINMNQGIVVQSSGADETSVGLYMEECYTNKSLVTQVFTANAAKSVMLYNNNFNLSGNHIAYCSVDRSWVHNNTFTKPAFGRTALRIYGEALAVNAGWTWVDENTMSGWIDPRTEPLHGREFASNRWNFSLNNLSPNATATGADTKTNHNIMYLNNNISGYEVALELANGKDILIKGGTWTTADTYSGLTSRLSMSGTFLQRPMQNVTVDGVTFVETANSTVANRIFGINSYDRQYCADQLQHAGFEVINCTFNLGDASTLIFEGNGTQKRNAQGGLDSITAAQWVTEYNNITTFTNNTITKTKNNNLLRLNGTTYTTLTPA